MHTFHKGPLVICAARASWHLPSTHLAGLIAHEIGHVISGPRGSEAAADLAAKARLSVTIRYKSSRHGENLEWSEPHAAARLLDELFGRH